MLTKLILESIIIIILNLPFGYWRANVKLFSLQWFLAIHLPVPFIITMRLLTNIGFMWYTFVFFVIAFFIGHRTGSYIHKRLIKKDITHTSCLVLDIRNVILLKRNK